MKGKKKASFKCSVSKGFSHLFWLSVLHANFSYCTLIFEMFSFLALPVEIKTTSKNILEGSDYEIKV